MRNLTGIILILAAIGIFFGFISPTYSEVGDVKAQKAEYQDALDQIEVLRTELRNHQSTIESYNQEDLARLNRFLPDNVDNVKLIIDVNNVAATLGLSITNLVLKQPGETTITLDDQDVAEAVAQAESVAPSIDDGQVYDSIDLSFSTTASYENFVSFLQELEKSLRLVDVVAISFVPTETGNTYDFSVTIRTYWLK